MNTRFARSTGRSMGISADIVDAIEEALNAYLNPKTHEVVIQPGLPNWNEDRALVFSTGVKPHPRGWQPKLHEVEKIIARVLPGFFIQQRVETRHMVMGYDCRACGTTHRRIYEEAFFVAVEDPWRRAVDRLLATACPPLTLGPAGRGT